MGGAGSAVQESLNAHGVVMPMPMLQLGLPDRYIDHGDQAAILSELGLDAAGIVSSVEARWGKHTTEGKVLRMARPTR